MERIEMTVPCGWCITSKCWDCKKELTWQNKVYVCMCTHENSDSRETESATVIE